MEWVEWTIVQQYEWIDESGLPRNDRFCLSAMASIDAQFQCIDWERVAEIGGWALPLM